LQVVRTTRACERLRGATATDSPRSLLQATIPRGLGNTLLHVGREFGVGGRTFASSPIIVLAWCAHRTACRWISLACANRGYQSTHLAVRLSNFVLRGNPDCSNFSDLAWRVPRHAFGAGDADRDRLFREHGSPRDSRINLFTNLKKSDVVGASTRSKPHRWWDNSPNLPSEKTRRTFTSPMHGPRHQFQQ
jgi:hypothetical protein